MAIDHSSRAFKRFKRNNVFPHLVAEDLANGIEHTPIDRFKLHEWAGGMGSVNPRTSLTATANALETAGNGQSAATIRDVADATTNPQTKPFVDNPGAAYKAPEGAAKATIPNKLEIKKFPLDLETQNSKTPYVLFKVFDSSTGAVEAQDATTVSLVTGATRATEVINGIPQADIAAAAVFGGQLAGTPGAIAAAIAVTDPGQAAINSVASEIFGKEVNITSAAKNLVKNFALKRNIQQIAEAIALFMPDGITSNYDHEYDALSVTATLGVVGFAAQAVGSTNGEVSAANPYIGEAAAALASKVIGGDDFAKLGLFATTGFVRNPQMELIYSTPVLRKFVFDFRLIPRTPAESDAILKIINSFKFHAAPRILTGSGGRYLIPPSQFQIEFYNADGTPNTNMFKTKNCVLTGISVDYTPNGYATFYDGMPVETRMQLSFQETSIISKDDIRIVDSNNQEVRVGY